MPEGGSRHRSAGLQTAAEEIERLALEDGVNPVFSNIVVRRKMG